MAILCRKYIQKVGYQHKTLQGTSDMPEFIIDSRNAGRSFTGALIK